MGGGESWGPLRRLYILSIESDSLSASSPVVAVLILLFPALFSSAHRCLLLDRDFRPLFEDIKVWGNVALWTGADDTAWLRLVEVSSNENCWWTWSTLYNGVWCWLWMFWWCWCRWTGVESGREFVESCWKVDNGLLEDGGERTTWGREGGGDRGVACSVGTLTK